MPHLRSYGCQTMGRFSPPSDKGSYRWKVDLRHPLRMSLSTPFTETVHRVKTTIMFPKQELRDFAFQITLVFASIGAMFGAQPIYAQQIKGFQRDVKVSAASDMDWVYVLANQSPQTAPEEWTKGYQSTAQSYELYVPERYDRKRQYPLLVFVSPSDQAMGFSYWKKLCEKEQMLFAGPHHAGNECEMPKRIHIVLDVISEVRRNYSVDPDRTYISGFSGGGRVACSIAFALPEYFGGVVPICASGDLRDEDWLRQRVIDRLSVAHLTGEDDFNRGEVERFRDPFLRGVGVRSKAWVAPRVGHTIPPEKWLGEAFEFVEAGLADRQKLAKQFPATRVDNAKSPDRETQAQALSNEATKRLQDPQSVHSGLMLLKGVMVRWPDLPLADKAKQTLLKYEDGKDQTWREADVALQRRFIVSRARAIDAYASGPLPQNYLAQRADMARNAIELWTIVIEDGQDAEAVAEAKRRVPELQKLVDDFGKKD